ncbi:MAG: TIR domain-containing protein [Lachnospiraceae bacterium]|nr:TIR domain-containing protein [Lachnospiraceae bacterium]
MTEHYNAFISYKHADIDIKVAEAIERGLEHFYVPWSIRKKTGIKRINHIFRDKDELPITSNLTEQISYALENSDFLIVICSTNTKTSAWVPREIEYFLRTHSRQQILTVLVDGEPFDVIPDILLHEDRTVLDDHGVSHTYRIPLEPLSCDFRSRKRRERKDELTRLASALLSCSYSELINRQRQYKVRRAAAAMTFVGLIAFAFCAYMFNSRKKIEAAYTESLRNRSRYLASESRTLFRNEQRITAMQVALAALPKDENDDKPVTPEAVRALTDATLAYVTKHGSNISDAWNYTMNNIVSKIIVSENGKILAANDISDNLMVWDTVTHELKLKKHFAPGEQRGFDLISDYNLIVVNEKNVSVVDVRDGSVKWSYTIEEDDSFSYDSIVHAGEDGIYLLLSSSMIVLDAADGHRISMYKFPNSDDSLFGFSVSKCELSPDRKKLAYCTLEDFSKYKLFIWNLETNKVIEYEDGVVDVRCMRWVDDEKILASIYMGDVFESSVKMGSRTLLRPDCADIICMKASDMSEVWRSAFVSDNVMINRDFVLLPKQNAVAYYSGNVCEIYNISNGETVFRHDANDSIVDVSDIDGDGTPLYITRGGALAVPAAEQGNDAVLLTDTFTDELTNAVVNNGVYVSKTGGRQIIYYGTSMYDGDWHPVEENLDTPDISCYMDENVLATVYNAIDETEETLLMVDLNNDASVISESLKDIGDGGVNNVSFLGSENGKLFFMNVVNSASAVYSVEIGNGRIEKLIDLSQEETLSVNPLLVSNSIVTMYRSAEQFKYVLKVYDLSTGKARETFLPDDLVSYGRIEGYRGSGLIAIEGKPLLIYDVNADRMVECEMPEDWERPEFAMKKSAGDLFAVADKNKIIVLDRDGRRVNEINCSELSVTGLGFYKDMLLVSSDSGYLYRYDVRTGELLGSSEITIHTSFVNTSEFYQDETKGIVVIMNGSSASVIDTASWVEMAYIENCYGYHAGSDRFFTEAENGEQTVSIGYFKRYTTEDLIEKAKNILQNQRLTREQKNEYGITDE